LPQSPCLPNSFVYTAIAQPKGRIAFTASLLLYQHSKHIISLQPSEKTSVKVDKAVLSLVSSYAVIVTSPEHNVTGIRIPHKTVMQQGGVPPVFQPAGAGQSGAGFC
jgi:hypothetical protein